jgi:antagonist of KipI
VSASGAADPLALRIGNRLVGNDDGAGALEMTLVGGSFRFDGNALIAVTGADADARLDGRRVAPWRSCPVRAGETLVCGALHGGARSYLCIGGGIVVPLVFGSASTHLLTGLGGHLGRALIVGDVLAIGASQPRAPFPRSVDPSGIPGYRRDEPFRTTDGPQADWFTGGALADLFETEWRVTEACDRMGIRLSGRTLCAVAARELTTEGVCLGAIQVPPGGLPIVLSVEHQTTGGYPKIANVIAADLPRLGTLRPRDTLTFARVGLSFARAQLKAQEDALDALLA